MKGKIIGKILIVLLAIVMVLPLSTFAAAAEEMPETNAVPEYIQDIYRNRRTPEAQADYNGLKWQLQLELDISYVRNYVEEQEKLAAQNKATKAKKEALEKAKKAVDDVRDKIPEIIAIAKDAENGGDFDTAMCVDSAISSISTIFTYFGPWGNLASSVIDLGNDIFKLAMGGESATSDLAQMEDRLNQRLDDIQKQLSEIEEQVNGLSDEINESTNTIINEVTSAIDNADAKAELRRFMLSGEGNFSYNQYRNYIYGTIENNPKANTAYYSWLKKSLGDGASDETVKYYYDKLYTVEFEINVVCGHGNNFTSSASGYAYNESLSQAPTCYSIGYNAYVCGTCGDIQYFYLRKTEHVPHECDHNFIDGTCDICGAREATCTEEGNTGKVLCADENCGSVLKKGTVLEDSAILKDGTILEAGTILENDTFIRTVLIDGKVISKLTHHYVYVDGDKHACTNGSHSEYHHYTVTESVQLLDPDKNGTKEWYIVYTYTCICQKENGEQYSKIEIDENSVTNETKELPTIAISNGYVTSGGKEVVVYVQLINNPGVKSAVFGIRYDRGLELIGDPQIGNLFKNLTINEKEQIDYGYNFVFAKAALVSGDGNLVKLTFKVADDAKIGDIFNISVVYNEMGKSVDGTPIMGGFSNGEQINVVTRDGYVKVVGEGQLPGDVNNDNIVDLMDAVLLAKFYANSEKYPLSAEDADINLDRDITPDDIVALLEYLVGGYGTNLLTQDFEIVLNTNGYSDIVLNDLLVSIYGDNNTYDAAGLNAIIAEIENRTGYKFLGWYDQMVGGNLIFGGNKTEDVLVVYNKNQKKQTLYAHWELNKISFDGNGADGNIEDVYYTESTTIELQNTYENKYNIVFVSDKCENQYGVLWYEFLGWNAYNKGYDKDGKPILIPILDENGDPIYYHAKSNLNFEEILDDFLNDHYGEVILVADWSKKPHLDYPEFLVNGYENTIHWYGDSEYSTDEIFPGINDEYIIHNLASVANKYKIYAKHIPIVYDIEFNFNGTSAEISTTAFSSIVYGRGIENPYTISGTVNKTGYTFVKWIDNFGNEYSEHDTVGLITQATQGCKVTLTAQWQGVEYTIIYNGNGATHGNTADSNHIYGESKALTENGFKRKYNITYVFNGNGQSNSTVIYEYKFIGWKLSNGVPYDNKQLVLNLVDKAGAKVMLDAQWSIVNFVLPTPTRPGHTFAGWYADSNLIYKVETVEPNEDMILYAKWIANTVSFDSTGGTACSTITMSSNGTYVDLPTPTRMDHYFVGWYYENIMVTDNMQAVTVGDHKLTAVWTLIKSSWDNGGSASNYITVRNDGMEYYLHTGLDREALRAAGYTHVSISGTIQGKRIYSWGAYNWYIEFYDCHDTKIHSDEIGKFDTSFETRNIQYTLSIDCIQDDGTIKIRFDHMGGSNDRGQYRIGLISITTIAIKPA